MNLIQFKHGRRKWLARQYANSHGQPRTFWQITPENQNWKYSGCCPPTWLQWISARAYFERLNTPPGAA